MLRLLGFRLHPIVSVLIGAGLIIVGLGLGKAMLAVVGGFVALMGLISAVTGRSGGSGGPR
jgi:hypothetical protein